MFLYKNDMKLDFKSSIELALFCIANGIVDKSTSIIIWSDCNGLFHW